MDRQRCESSRHVLHDAVVICRAEVDGIDGRGVPLISTSLNRFGSVGRLLCRIRRFTQLVTEEFPAL